jgi:hypothetical protein
MIYSPQKVLVQGIICLACASTSAAADSKSKLSQTTSVSWLLDRIHISFSISRGCVHTQSLLFLLRDLVSVLANEFSSNTAPATALLRSN